MEYIFKIIRSKRRSISIEVNFDKELIIRAPKNIPDNEITKLIEGKDAWIKKVMGRASTTDTENISIETGGLLLYLGVRYPVKITDGTNINVNEFIEIPDFYIKRNVKRWYVKKAEEIIKQRLRAINESVGNVYKKMKITHGVKTIGSCSGKGYINFSWLLILMPVDLLDYVIIHELCHLKVRNHSQKFWKEVSTFLPDYKTKRKLVKKYSVIFNKYYKYFYGK